MTVEDKKATKKRAKSNELLSEEERAAMRETVKERRAQAGASEADGEADVLAKIAEMSAPDRAMAERVHALIKAAAPTLSPRTWYGMPAYAKNGQILCHFQPAEKFKSRYATLGFSDKASLDDGAMWPVVYALKELTADVEAKITGLVKQAAS